MPGHRPAPLLLLLLLAASCRSAGSGEPTRAAPSIAATSNEQSPPASPLHLPAIQAKPAPNAAEPAPSTAEPAPNAAPAGPLRVVVVGDSLSDPKVGGGGYVANGLRACKEKQVVSLAKGGFMLNQMRRKLEREIARGLGSASHVIVFGGVNDVYSDETAGRVPSKIKADLAAIYALCRSLGARVIGVTIAPWGGFSPWYTPKRGSATEEVNAWIREQAERGTIDALVDASRLLTCGDPVRLCPEYEPPFRDGLHFGPRGHEVLGRALAGHFPNCR